MSYDFSDRQNQEFAAITDKTESLSHLPRLIPPLVLYSSVTNLAILVSPLFMMQVLDRVVPSGNHATLILLLILALAALLVSAGVEYARDLSLKRAGFWLESICLPTVLHMPADLQRERLADMTTLRDFVAGPSAVSFLNMLWLPFFLLALAFIHPLYLAITGGTFILTLAVGQFVASRTRLGIQKSGEYGRLAGALSRKYQDICGGQNMLQIGENIGRHITTLHELRRQADEQILPDQTAKSALSGFLRMAAQLWALSLGAYLVSLELISAGAMIGASIISSKTLAALEGALPAQNDAKAARISWQNLRSAKSSVPPATDVFDLSGSLKCDGLIMPRGGGAPPRLDRISFELAPGSCLAIIGASGGGKSTLLHALAGLAPAPIGTVFLDQTDIRQLGAAARAKAVGFVPQLPPLIPGSIAEIISGFSLSPSDEAILRAAKQTKVHGLISALPQSYETNLAEFPHALTMGQRQQIALSAALYHDPKYLFLDEPNALLDQDGERRLCEVLSDLKEGGTSIVMILHRAGIIGLADQVMVLDQGRMVDFGPRPQVLGRQIEAKRQIRLPLRPSSLQDLTDWINSQFTRTGDAGFSSKAVLLGTELFNAACLNGPQSGPREVLIVFKFINDQNCSLELHENNPTEADRALPKIRSFMKHPNVDASDFTAKELPLVLAAQLSETLDIKNIDKTAVFTAKLRSDVTTFTEANIL